MVSPMYYGETKTTIDDKARITVPARLRQTMGVLKHSDWYMACGYDHCIFLYPHQEWQKVVDHFGHYAPMDPYALDFRRLLFGSVTEVALDGQGRMPLAPYLRDHAGLQPRTEAVVVGVGEHIEIWNLEAWRAFREAREPQLKDMARGISAVPSDQGRAVVAVGAGTDNTSDL